LRQLNYIEAGKLEWHDVPEPALPSGLGALVRPLVVTTCDFDGIVISGVARFKGPLPVGHEGVAEVIDVGDDVRRFKPGDRVIVPWKISCGECANCRAGLTAHCMSVPREAAYSFLADVVAVPWADHMLCPLPAGVDPLAASGVADNITDAWRAVAQPLSTRPGGRVLVAGGGGPGSIGLMSAGLARVLGAGEIVYLDWDEGRRRIAEERFGARTFDTTDGLPELEGEQFDVLVDGSGNPAALRLLIDRAAAGAFATSTAGAIYAFGDVPFPVLHMYRQSVTFHTGWVSTRPVMEEPLELIAAGAFDPRVVETAVLGFEDATGALAQPFTKLAFVREEQTA
jgi:threonine dehydrogenase-like Zn-dependent dehydrogenase